VGIPEVGAMTGLPGGIQLMAYFWNTLKALGAATFLYIYGVGLLCIYYDLQIWMLCPNDEGRED
jgi:hypothetical protein